MLIALDYDQTYTRDPDYWDAVIALGVMGGHQFICVTNRPWPPGETKPERVPKIPIICAGDQFKSDAAREAGYTVSVWIDDMPGSISQSLILP